MSFVSRSMMLAVVPALMLGAAPLTLACDVGTQKVEKVLGKKVAVYTKSGDFQKEIDARAVQIDEPLVACQDTPALVQVKVVGSDPVWVDRLDVKIAGGNVTARNCKKQGVSRESDTHAPAVSGIDPCSG
ncbi:MAG: hypothetical protein WDO56_27530 [Gammaproteobacteria bacterium]